MPISKDEFLKGTEGNDILNFLKRRSKKAFTANEIVQFFTKGNNFFEDLKNVIWFARELEVLLSMGYVEGRLVGDEVYYALGHSG